MWSRSRMFLVCLWQTQRKLPPTMQVLLSTHPNTSTPLRELWVEVCSRAWWRGMLNCSFQGQNTERWTWTHLSSSWCRQHPPPPVHGRDLQGLQRGGAACRVWDGKSSPSLQAPGQSHETTQQLKVFLGFLFLLCVKGSKELFLYPSNSLWTVSETWEVS